MDNNEKGTKNYYAEDITNDKSNKSYWVNLLVRKWIVKLGLSEPFRIVLDVQKDHKFKRSMVFWEKTEKVWEIRYKYLKDPIYDVRETLIHEIGHVYLYKILNSIKFVKQQEEIILTPIEAKLKDLVNLLEDQFVDYNLSKFPEFYKVASDNSKKFVIGNRFKDDISLYFAIHSYIKFYLEFNYILRDKERSEVSKWVLFNLKVLRAIIIERYKEINKKFSMENFDRLDAKLNEFNKLKDLSYLLKENSGLIILAKKFEIVKFYYDVVKCLGLFNSNLTKNFLWKKYGVKPNTDSN